MVWNRDIFDELVAQYPRGRRDDVVRAFGFTNTRMTSPNSCALRLSFALHHVDPSFMRGFAGNTWTTSNSVPLARGSTALANHIRRRSGWAMQRRTGPGAGRPMAHHFVPEGQGIMYFKGLMEGDYHIDLWDRDRHLDAAAGLTMLWRPAPRDTLEVWYWRLEQPDTMIFGLNELGQGGTFR